MSNSKGLNIFTAQEVFLITGVISTFSTIEGNSQIIGEGKTEQIIDSTWRALEAVDSDIAKKRLDRSSVIKLMIEVRCSNLTPQGARELIFAIERKINRQKKYKISDPKGLNIFTGQEAFLICAVIKAASSLQDDEAKLLEKSAITRNVNYYWKAIETADSEIVTNKLNRFSAIKVMVGVSCPNLTPQGVREVASAIAQKLG